MFGNTNRKILTGLITGALLSTSTVFVFAKDEDKTYHLLDSQGKPVLTSVDKKCVETPQSPNDPAKRFEQCGDISDRDGDGVPDDEDLCPDNTPEEIALGVYGDANHLEIPAHGRKGCPIDTDGDGVPDYRDDCPNTPPDEIGCVNERGCTKDSDGDGINDCKDACPDTRPEDISKVNEIGCAKGQEKAEVTTELRSETLFDFDKYTLKSEGMMELNNIITGIRQEGAYFSIVNVVGHTDPVGSDSYNMNLSVQRARAVADYLIANGVPADKVMQEGRGESQCTLPERLAGEATTARNARLEPCRRVDIIMKLFRKVSP